MAVFGLIKTESGHDRPSEFSISQSDFYFHCHLSCSQKVLGFQFLHDPLVSYNVLLWLIFIYLFFLVVVSLSSSSSAFHTGRDQQLLPAFITTEENADWSLQLHTVLIPVKNWLHFVFTPSSGLCISRYVPCLFFPQVTSNANCNEN